jgi:hypothetical protein
LGVFGVPLVRGKVIFNIIVGEENFMDLEESFGLFVLG